MKRAGTAKREGKKGGMGIGASLLAGFCLLAPMMSAQAGDFDVPLTIESPPAEDEWGFGVSLNAWGPQINATTFNGGEINLGLDDIVRDLNMVLMMTAVVEKGKWSFGTDLLYMDIQQNIFAKPGGAKLKSDVDLNAWIVTPKIGYRAFEGDWGQFHVFGGARYLYLGVDTKVVLGLPLPVGNVTTVGSQSGSEWAAIAGFRGHYNLSEKWFLPYYFDIGAGDPDLTVQAFAGVGYRARCFDVTLGYRYLKWDLGSGAALTDLEIKGPMLAAIWRF